MSELLPCPFCGGEPVEDLVRDGRVVRCRGCAASGPAKYHGPSSMPTAQVRAIAAWNTRPSIVGMVPGGCRLSMISWDERRQLFLALIERPEPAIEGVVALWRQFNGTGPTPELAIQDAASKVQP